MATTTNFGWETPDDTDLVKDGAAAMRTLGNSIDTSFVDLKGGTTGQILSKASNTDLDYTWIAANPGDITEVAAGTGISGGGTSGAVTITNSMATAIDAKGDLIAGTGADAFARLAIGTNNQVLTADSSTSTGMKWASASPAGKNYVLLNTGGTALTGSATITVSSLSGYENYFIHIDTASTATAASEISFRINSDSGGNYVYGGLALEFLSTYQPYIASGISSTGLTYYFLGIQSSAAGGSFSSGIHIDGGSSTGTKSIQSNFGSSQIGGNNAYSSVTGGLYKGSAVISSISIRSGNGNFDAGTVYIYGSV